jgi:hypothetical protein
MRAFEPQHCRPANMWRSRAIHAPSPAVTVRVPSEIAGLRDELVVAGNVVRRRAASSRAPSYQEAAPGERGEVARAVGTTVASACPCVFRAWPSAGQAVRETAATRLGIGVIFDPGSLSSRVLLCGKLGIVPCDLLQVKGVDAVPRCAGGGRLEPGYRVDAPRAERENAGTGACPAGAPQRRAATRRRGPIARVTTWREALKPGTSDVPCSRRVCLAFRRTLGGHVSPARDAK